MTIAASGQIILPTEIHNELRTSGELVIPSTPVRWLAEKPTGNLVLPTDLYGKAAVKIVDDQNQYSDHASQYTFTGVDLGTDFVGRTIIVVTHLMSTVNAILNVTSVTINGVATGGGDAGENTASLGSAGAGIWSGSPSGTTATIVVNYDNGGFSGVANGCAITVIAAAGLNGTHDTASAHGGGAGSDGLTPNIDIPANGVLITAVTRANNSPITFIGATEAKDEIFRDVARRGCAIINRLSVQTDRQVGFTSSGVVASGFTARSYE